MLFSLGHGKVNFPGETQGSFITVDCVETAVDMNECKQRLTRINAIHCNPLQKDTREPLVASGAANIIDVHIILRQPMAVAMEH